nr:MULTISPECIES: hypothetical protein [Frankia]
MDVRRVLNSFVPRRQAWARLDETVQDTGLADDTTGVLNPDFLALGLGATNMMGMLWSLALGRRVVGVELRGDPSLGVHWNIREDLYHHLGLIDQMMLERYGEAGIPRRGDGSLFILAECFYRPDTPAGAVTADEVVSGFLDALVGEPARIGGRIFHTEFIDDRWKDGKPHRTVTVLTPPEPPRRPDPTRVGRSTLEALEGPSTFQSAASEVMVLMRRYLEGVERMDLARGVTPRVRLFLSHRVVTTGTGSDAGYLKWLRREEGFGDASGGRKSIRIEQVRELDYNGRFHRVRVPGSKVIDIGIPELFMIAQGFNSTDADRLGFRQEDVLVDHHDGRGPVVAQADYLAGLLEVLVDGRLRRRIASDFDKEGNEYWVRQIAVGHEDDAEVGWILVQVPDYKTFDPILSGLVPPGTYRKSKQYRAGVQHLMREFYLDQVSQICEMPVSELERIQMPYGPKLFSLVERAGVDAQVAANGVVAGDTFGNGHFLTSGGAITGMIGHGHRVKLYWEARDAGVPHEQAIRGLADGIKQDTDDWFAVSAQEFSTALPINFGSERIATIEAAGGHRSSARATTIDATRRHRHTLVPLDPSDWRRLLVRSGRMHALALPPIPMTHPVVRGGGGLPDPADAQQDGATAGMGAGMGGCMVQPGGAMGGMDGAMAEVAAQ